jgi:uncharacterized damage-inducible protein DinB
MSLEAIRSVYAFHHWANRTLFDEALARGEAACERDMGKQWSFPTVRRMFAHIYGADAIWLSRWRGAPLPAIPGGDLPSMSAVRAAWDPLEAEQRAFLAALTDADLARTLDYRTTDGEVGRASFAQILPHVPNHATHHRSEICTMLTLIGGSPTELGIAQFIARTGGRG